MPGRNRSESRYTRTLPATVTALTVAALLPLSGCDPKPDSSSAPYGAPAAASSAPVAPPDAPRAAPSTGAVGPLSAGTPGGGETAGAPGPGSAAAPGGGLKGDGGAGMPPMMGMGSAPTAPLSPTPELDTAITKAEAGKDKKAIAKAYADRGTFRMNDEKAGARVKYRAALEDYRKALAADPANEEAKKNKDMIENIYKSMGRPIPGAEAK